MSRNILMGTAALAVCFAAASLSQAAIIITPTGGTSGGNPGGQPLFEVSGLVEGDAFNVDWGGVAGLSASAMVFIDELTATTADVRVMLDNNSTPISGDDPRVTAFGVGDANELSVGNTATGGAFLDDADESNSPGFAILVCATSGNNCAGGGLGGIPAGSSDTFTLELTGNFGGSLTLDSFALKVQGGPNGNSFELAGVPTPKIPEPSALVLLLLSAVPLLVTRRQ